MRQLLLLFAFVLGAAGALSAQETFRAPRPDPDPVQAAPQRFEKQVAQLRQALKTNDEHALIAAESAILGGMREELERSESAAAARLTRQRNIFSEFENFSFYKARPAEAEAKLLLLDEFAGTMKDQ